MLPTTLRTFGARLLWAICLGLTLGLGGSASTAGAADDALGTAVNVTAMRAEGRIVKNELYLTLHFTATANVVGARLEVLRYVLEAKEDSHTVALAEVPVAKGWHLELDRGDFILVMDEGDGPVDVNLSFVLQSKAVDTAQSRQVSFLMPDAAQRELVVVLDDPAGKVVLRDAVGASQRVTAESVTVTALMPPGRLQRLRWQRQVEAEEAELLLDCQANVIAQVAASRITLDAVYTFTVNQGGVQTLRFAVPHGLNVSQVRSPDLRDWRLEDAAGKEAATPTDVARSAGENAERILTVALNRQVTDVSIVRIVAEQTLADLPVETALPVIRPLDGTRANGALAIGTDSALQLQIRTTEGLSQIDSDAFPRVDLSGDETTHSLPRGKVFCYLFPATPYGAQLAVSKVEPVYDADLQVVLTASDDNLELSLDADIDVREAPISRISFTIPATFLVASVSGNAVGDYVVNDVIEQGSDSAWKTLNIVFKGPVTGRTALQVRLETGRTPLGATVSLDRLSVDGARAERGFVVLAGGEGVVIDPPVVNALREVNTRAIPMRVTDARFAYRFRERGWSLRSPIREKAPAIRAETFHLVSLGDGLAYNSAVTTYLITGAPVDVLQFRLPEDFTNVEFVGMDVARWTHDNGVWQVHLRRKILGDYNLGLTAIQRFADGSALAVGGIACEGVDTQTGYVTMASHRDVQVVAAPTVAATVAPSAPGAGAASAALIPLANEELPASYRLLVNAPILRCYKYIDAPRPVALTVSAFQHGTTPTVLLDFVRAETTLSVNPERAAEAMTTIRYTLKNGTAQFLDLDVPAPLVVWSTQQVETKADGSETVTRLTAARDTLPGGGLRLKVPLARQENPNLPITVEVVVGQPVGRLARFSGHMTLTLPVSQVPATFSEWHIVAPADWSILPGRHDGMEVQSGGSPRSELGALLAGLGRHWITNLFHNSKIAGLSIPGIIVILMLLVLSRMLRRAWPLWLALAVCLAALALVGAADSPGFGRSTTADGRSVLQVRPDQHRIDLRAVLNLDTTSPMQATIRMLPDWQVAYRLGGLVLFGLLAVAAGCLAWRRPEWRAAGGCLMIVALGLALLQTPWGLMVWWISLTWATPLALALLALIHTVRTYRLASSRPDIRRRIAPGTATLLGAVLLLGGGLATPSANAADDDRATTTTVEEQPWTWGMPDDAQRMLERVDTEVWVGAEIVRIEYTLYSNLTTPRTVLFNEMRFIPAPATASATAPAADAGPAVTLITARPVKNGQEIELPAGRQIGRVAFILNLPPSGADQERSLYLPSPAAAYRRATAHFANANVRATFGGVGESSTLDATGGGRTVTALLAPATNGGLTWRPVAFAESDVAPDYMVDLTSIARAESGRVNLQHEIVIRIARGKLDRVAVQIPETMLVTQVQADGLATWRFDLATRLLTLRFKSPSFDTLNISLMTQIVAGNMPYDTTLRLPRVQGATTQHTSLGIAVARETQIKDTSTSHAPGDNLADFRRRAAGLLKTTPALAGELQQAYRMDEADAEVRLAVVPVEPEIRVTENATFSIGDDHLVYNGTLDIAVTKTTIFHLDLAMPAGYDIDQLGGEGVSHWDDSEAAGVRTVRVYFKAQRQGAIRLDVALSRPVTALPDTLSPPRLDVPGALKHSGQLVIAAERGVRLSIKEREGVSELDVATLGLRDKPALAVKLLRPNWLLTLQIETLVPRLDLTFLHLARVSDGLVRHTQYLRYQIQNAGERAFEIIVPPDALGLVLSGPEIARRVPLDEPGHWRIELSGKWFDRSYPLEVRYETRYDAAVGEIAVQPVQALAVESQRGYVAILTTGRVAVTPTRLDAALQPAEARTLPNRFGADDLADAVYCYAVPSGEYDLRLHAVRHDEANLLAAQILDTQVQSVVSVTGATLNRVDLLILTGAKRHLQCILPANSEVWSLLVDRQARTPSYTTDASGQRALLIPLPQSTGNNTHSRIELIYASAAAPGWTPGRQSYVGPRFDLPLQGVRWQFQVADGVRYHDFAGTLQHETDVDQASTYSFSSYLNNVKLIHAADYQTAVQLQQTGIDLAQQGKPVAARQALEQAYSYSINNRALNEDARVKLKSLLRQQAMVGLVDRRQRVRTLDANDDAASIGASFTLQDAQRLSNGLSKSDSENLERIANRVLEVQDAAAPSALQILVTLPMQGRNLAFVRPLQVQADAPMLVTFAANPPWLDAARWNSLLRLGLLLVALVVGLLIQRFAGRCCRLQTATAVNDSDDASDESDDDEYEDAEDDDDTDEGDDTDDEPKAVAPAQNVALPAPPPPGGDGPQSGSAHNDDSASTNRRNSNV